MGIETRPVSWLGGIPKNRDSGAAFPPRVRASVARIRDSDARLLLHRLTVARRRRLFTVFPCAESRVIVDGASGQCFHPAAPQKKTEKL
jgi:hypothetical protein